jgi:hypothetical protein
MRMLQQPRNCTTSVWERGRGERGGEIFADDSGDQRGRERGPEGQFRPSASFKATQQKSMNKKWGRLPSFQPIGQELTAGSLFIPHIFFDPHELDSSVNKVGKLATAQSTEFH